MKPTREFLRKAETRKVIQPMGATLRITEDDRSAGMRIINAVIYAPDYTQEQLGEAVVKIFRDGLFTGARAMGAVVVEDLTRPVTFWAKLKALFRKG